MSNRRRKVRPIGVAVLALIVLVPIVVASLVIKAVSKPAGQETSGAPASVSTVEKAPASSSERPMPSDPDQAPVKESETAEPATEEMLPATVEPEPAAPATSSTTPAPAEVSGKAAAIAELAKKLIGSPWVYGAAGPAVFDNTGFVYYVCRQNGVDAPRTIAEIKRFGAEVKREALVPGDVVIFTNELGGSGDFEGVYAGEDQFIACFNSNAPTAQASMADGSYWGQRYVTARRVG